MAVKQVGLSPAAATDAVTKGYFDTVVERVPPVAAHFPRVMTTPPTITISNNRDSPTMTPVLTMPGVSYTSMLPGDMTRYTALGVGPAAPRVGSANGATGYDYYAASWEAGVTAPKIVIWEFLFDGLQFEFSLRQFAGSQFHVMVDGEYATQYPQTFGGDQGSYGNVKVVFATQRLRRISFEFTTTGYETMGAWRGPTDTLRAVGRPTRSLVIAGDSYTGGAVSTGIGSWGKYAARTLGFTDFFNAGLGGSGWLATSTVNGTAYNIANRLTGDVIAQAPTDVIIALGHNDTAFSNSAIGAQVTSVLTTLRAQLPNLKNLIVVGPFFSGGAGVYTAMGTAIQAACAGLALYVDTVANPIFTGTGRVGATANDGNSDLYISSDNVHPTDAGSAWLGYSVGRAISQTVGFASPSATPAPVGGGAVVDDTTTAANRVWSSTKTSAGIAAATTTVVEHGSNASIVRPAVSGSVRWIGTVQPANWVDGDDWWEATPYVVPDIPTTSLASHWRVSTLALTQGAAISSVPNRVSGGPALAAVGGTVYDIESSVGSALFDGVDDRLEETTTSLAQPSTFIAIGRFVTAAASKPFAGATTGLNAITATSGSLWSANAGTSLQHTAAINTGWHMVAAVFNGASSIIYVDGVAVTGQAGTTARTGTRFGANSGLTAFANMKLAESAIYSVAKTTSELDAIRAIYKQRYTVLP